MAAEGNDSLVTRGHNFESHSYGLIPTQCFICNEFLNGFWQDAYQCQNCSINVHEACRVQAGLRCFVTHRFQETSYVNIPNCSACGQPIVGFWKQGFKCLDCGLDVHPACRTQSSVSNCPLASTPPPLIEEWSRSSLASSQQLQAKIGNSSGKRNSFLKGKQSSQKSALATAGSSSSLLLLKEPLPTDLEGVKREIKKLHEEQLEASRISEDQWEKVTKPGLKSQRAQLDKQYDQAKLRLKEKQTKVIQLSSARDEKFRQFLKAFYQKYNPSKVQNIESVIRHFGSGKLKERDLFTELIEKYANEPSAIAFLEHERAFGFLQEFDLDDAHIELEEAVVDLGSIRTALSSVRRDIYFSPNIPWLVKGGSDGTYAGFSSLWLEECIGLFHLKCFVCKGDFSQSSSSSNPNDIPQLPPGDDGYRPRISMQLSGLKDSSELGWRVSARLEDMCISGSALPMSLSLRDADIFLQFDLSIDIQYDPPTSADDPCGSWRVIEDLFKNKMHKFQIKTKSTGSLGIPDVVLGALLQAILSVATRKLLVMVVPPEFGSYMLAVHRHRKSRRDNPAYQPESDSVATLWQSEDDNKDEFEERFLKLETTVKINQTLDFDAVDAKLRKQDDRATKQVLERLNLSYDQIKLFFLTQQELGLTYGSIWGSQNKDWLSTLATTVTGSTVDTSRIPMESLLDMLKYHREFLDLNTADHGGILRHRRAYIVQRLHDLWQQALELVCEQYGGESTEAGLTSKMKRMVASKFMRKDQGPLRSFDFSTFAKCLGELKKKEVYSEIDVSVYEVCIAVRSVIRSFRDGALRLLNKGKVVLSKKSHNNHNHQNRTLPHKTESSASSSSTGVGKDFANALEADKFENRNVLVPDFGKSLPVRIHSISEYVLDKLREVQERYVDQVRYRLELIAGDGKYRSTAYDFRMIAPVDVGLQIGSKLVGNVFSYTVKPPGNAVWLWNRKATLENGTFKVEYSRDNSQAPAESSVAKAAGGSGIMLDAFRRMGGKAAEVATADEGTFYSAYSGVMVQLKTEGGGAVSDILSLNAKPLVGPDVLSVKAVGANAMRVHVSVERSESAGQFTTYFHYIDDFLAYLARDIPEVERLRVLPKFVAGFAGRDSFKIDTTSWITIKSDHVAGDIVYHGCNLKGRSCVKVNLTHHLEDLLIDLMDIAQAATKFSPPTTKE